MCGEGRHKTEAAPQSVYGNVLMIVGRLFRRPVPFQLIGIYAVYDINKMTTPGELVRQPLDKDSVSPEVVRRVEGGDHAEAQRSLHVRMAQAHFRSKRFRISLSDRADFCWTCMVRKRENHSGFTMGRPFESGTSRKSVAPEQPILSGAMT